MFLRDFFYLSTLGNNIQLILLKMLFIRFISVFKDPAANPWGQGLVGALTAAVLATVFVLPMSAQAQDAKSSAKKRPVVTAANFNKKTKAITGKANKRVPGAAKAVPMRASGGQMAGLQKA